MLTEHPRAENADGLSIMALTGGDVFKGEDFSFHNSKAHYQGFFVRCQGWKARFIGKSAEGAKRKTQGYI